MRRRSRALSLRSAPRGLLGSTESILEEQAMSEIAIYHHPAIRRTQGAGRRAALAAVVTIIVGGLGFLIAVSTVDVARAWYATATATVTRDPVASHPVYELPREWRRSPKLVEYEHMYYRKGSRRLDWIRDSRSR
jgi:hypothetical protein